MKSLLAIGLLLLTCHAALAQPKVQGTRIAVVNIGTVFSGYSRANGSHRFPVDEQLLPSKEKAKKLSEEIKGWTEQMRDPKFNPTHKSAYDAAILKNQRELEVMEQEVKDLLAKAQQEQLVILWKDLNAAIKAVAEAQGFHIVLGYGDPGEKEMLNGFPNVNRKMQAMDLGSTVPLYIHGSVDITDAVLMTLNSPRLIQPPKKQ